MCIFRLGDGRCYIAAWSLGSLPASSSGPALHGSVGAEWRGKASVRQGAVVARRRSPGADEQPCRWTVTEGRTSPVGALTEMGNGERDLGGGDYVCLPRQYCSPSPASAFPCQPVLVQLILLQPLRPRRLRTQWGCYRGSPCELGGGPSL